MTEQKNLWVAIALSVAILIGFQVFFPAEKPAPVPQTTASTSAAGISAPSADGIAAPAPAPSGANLPDVTSGGVMDRAAALRSAARLKIETERLHGSIALTGGRLDDLTLRDYRKTVDPTSPEIELLNPRNAPHPYYVEFGWSPAGGEGVRVPDANTVWTASDDVLTSAKPVVLTWDNGAGLVFAREIAVDENYMFTVRQTVRNSSGSDVTLFPYGLIRRHGMPDISNFYILHEGFLGGFGEEVKEENYSTIIDDGKFEARSASGGWVGITDKYWLTALIPDQRTAFSGAFRHSGAAGSDTFQADYLADAVVIPAGGSATVTDRLFAGAKEVDVVDAYAERLGISRFDLAIDWGWFRFLTKPIFLGIDFLYGIVGNFGIAIILFTFVVKFLFLPLAWKSYVSMNAMKELQPEMMKLRERYADNRQAMQTEMMALYKRHKVNPVSGCLPILLQIPVFFSLYKVLFVSIEMRHAPFFGWITDLSAPDSTNIFTLFGLLEWGPPSFMHLGILPILMGLSMWAQQRMNPQPPDPTQARIMMMLPIVFTFVLAGFAAGLVIYWITNNLLSIAQQWFIKRQMARRAAAKAAT